MFYWLGYFAGWIEGRILIIVKSIHIALLFGWDGHYFHIGLQMPLPEEAQYVK